MNVKLRQRKQTSKGMISLYLEIYKGSIKTPEGKTKILREYEYLNLYLVDKPKNPIDKQSNKNTLELARSIRSKRELDIKNGQYGFGSDFKLNTSFIEYFQKLADERFKSKGNYGNWNSTIKHFEAFAGIHLTFGNIDANLCKRFKEHLQNEARTKSKHPLSTSSQSSYFNKFRACLKQAVKDKIILSNPCDNIIGIKVFEAKREYLTLDELRAAAKAECRYDVLKRAFLFSCLTGLRWGDIHKLTWVEVADNKTGCRITFHQQKTKGLQYHDISPQARAYLGTPGRPDEKVFIGIRYSDYMNVELSRWMMRAGITKPITFHCGRHTFAVMQLEHGTDIYTLKELLGHKELRTTEVYAKIMDVKKREAVNKIPEINI